MFNLINIFAKYYVFYTKKLYSTHSVNKLSITPVISYLNADLEKATILKQNKSKSGIYR
jgi:hypothetical protein